MYKKIANILTTGGKKLLVLSSNPPRSTQTLYEICFDYNLEVSYLCKFSGCINILYQQIACRSTEDVDMEPYTKMREVKQIELSCM